MKLEIVTPEGEYFNAEVETVESFMIFLENRQQLLSGSEKNP